MKKILKDAGWTAVKLTFGLFVFSFGIIGVMLFVMYPWQTIIGAALLIWFCISFGPSFDSNL